MSVSIIFHAFKSFFKIIFTKVVFSKLSVQYHPWEFFWVELCRSWYCCEASWRIVKHPCLWEYSFTFRIISCFRWKIYSRPNYLASFNNSWGNGSIYSKAVVVAINYRFRTPLEATPLPQIVTFPLSCFRDACIEVQDLEKFYVYVVFLEYFAIQNFKTYISQKKLPLLKKIQNYVVYLFKLKQNFNFFLFEFSIFFWISFFIPALRKTFLITWDVTFTLEDAGRSSIRFWSEHICFFKVTL